MGSEVVRFVICGGRSYTDAAKMYAVLQPICDEFPKARFAQGGAFGADLLARQWLRKRGYPCRTFYADWRAHGKKAGPMRNRQMLEGFQPDVVIAFPGGKGTRDCITQAKSYLGILVVVVDEATTGESIVRQYREMLQATDNELAELEDDTCQECEGNGFTQMCDCGEPDCSLDHQEECTNCDNSGYSDQEE